MARSAAWISAFFALALPLAASADPPIDETIEALDQAIAATPHDVELLMRRGDLFLREARPADALADVHVVLALAPDDARALVLEARALFDVGREEAALASIDRAIELAPTSFDALRTRATLRAALGDRPGAIEDLDTALALADDVDGYLTRARLLQAEHRTLEAARGLETAIAATDQSAALVLACVDLWLESGEPARALPLVDAASARAPSDARLVILRGDVLAAAGRAEEASLAYADALARIDARLARRSTVAGLVDRGDALARLGRVAEAETALAAALAREPEYPRAQALAARLGHARGAR
jgi:tetratricopeptide (TPR) repeat protein